MGFGAEPWRKKRLATATLSPPTAAGEGEREGVHEHAHRHEEQEQRHADGHAEQVVDPGGDGDRSDREQHVGDPAERDDPPSLPGEQLDVDRTSRRRARRRAYRRSGHRPEAGEVTGDDRREPRRQRLVGELHDRAGTRRGAHAPPQVVVGEEGGERTAARRGHDRRPRSRSRRRPPPRATRRCARRPRERPPPLPRGTRSRTPRPPARPTGRGRASRTRRRRRTGAGRSRRRGPARGTAPGRRSRAGARGRSRRARSRPAPAIASWTSGRPATASTSTSKPLRGTSRLTPSTSGRSGSRPKARRVGTPIGVGIGRKRSHVDARRHDDTAQPVAGRALASRAGYRPAATMPAAPRRTLLAELSASRETAGHRDLGAVHDHDVRRRGQAGTELAERQPRIEQDHRRVDLAGEAVDAIRRASGSGKNCRSARGRRGTAAPRPTPRHRRGAW